MLDSCKQFEFAMKHANELSNDFRFKQYIGSHSKYKKNIREYNDTRWLSRANTCKDIVDFYATMKHFETTINKLIGIRNTNNSQKIQEYVIPITNDDYNICLTLNPTLRKLKKLILFFEKRSHDGFFNALKKIYNYSQKIKAELVTNGLGYIYNQYENYLIMKLKKYSKLSELIAIGSLLNPNLEISELIEDEFPFYFLIDLGMNAITKKLQMENEVENSQNIRKKGERRSKDNLNEFEMWIRVVKPIKQKEDDQYYHYWKEQTSFPKLREIALTICSFQTSSTDCERMFSIAKYILGLNRCNILRENVEMAVLLYANFAITKIALENKK